MFLEMKVKQLALDPLSNMPIIILRDEEEKRSLPIWVGLFEANAIALELEKITTARPMTHDLIKNILESLDARVVKVVVNDLRENTFYGPPPPARLGGDHRRLPSLGRHRSRPARGGVDLRGRGGRAQGQERRSDQGARSRQGPRRGPDDHQELARLDQAGGLRKDRARQRARPG